MKNAPLEALKALVGPAGYLDAGPDMDPYLTDLRRLHRGRSPLVLLPATTDQVAQVVRICAQHRIGIVPQGGNTGYCGGATPDHGGAQVILALQRLNRIRRIDPSGDAITVEAGCTLAQVRQAAESADRLFPLSLGSEGTCQIGGNVSTNAGGTAVLRYGMMRALVLGLEVVLADGRVIEGLKPLRKDNSGYRLHELFIGSEGTLGIVTAACLKLFPRPVERATALAAVADPAAAVQLLSALRTAAGEQLSTFELMPRLAVELTSQHIPGVRDPFSSAYEWYVLTELAASNSGSGIQTTLEEILTAHALDAVVATSLQQREALWRMRETVPEAQRHAGASIKHDIAVPIGDIARFIREAGDRVAENVPDGQLIAYGHLGDGNLHFNIQQRPGTDAAQFLARAPHIHRTIHDLVAAYCGSFSAEHGIGQLKLEDMRRYKSPTELAVMRAMKQALDPQGILNPGKVVPAAGN